MQYIVTVGAVGQWTQGMTCTDEQISKMGADPQDWLSNGFIEPYDGDPITEVPPAAFMDKPKPLPKNAAHQELPPQAQPKNKGGRPRKYPLPAQTVATQPQPTV